MRPGQMRLSKGATAMHVGTGLTAQVQPQRTPNARFVGCNPLLGPHPFDSLPFWRLPEFNLVPLRVYYPAELPVL